MTSNDSILCRLRAAHWRVEQSKAIFDSLEGAHAGDKVKQLASRAWSDVCLERIRAWEMEAVR